MDQKTRKDIPKIKKVRDFLKNIKDYKRIKIIKRKETLVLRPTLLMV